LCAAVDVRRGVHPGGDAFVGAEHLDMILRCWLSALGYPR